MQIYKTEKGAVIAHEGHCYLKAIDDWDVFINRVGLYGALLTDIATLPKTADIPQNVLAPIGSQEVWASGVTYFRSKQARMEESKKAGGGSFYDLVYDADRPELFFKATPRRTVGQLGTVRIRKDSHWNVPEPELTLFLSVSGTIEGYTVGNDMSSRSIEGENPLYLPQAKTYDGCAALGPGIYVPERPIAATTSIKMVIRRNGSTVFEGETTLAQMKRNPADLARYLFRECSFPQGCFLMTGTGIVPPDNFSLNIGDEVDITIDHIGTLTNTVE
ncbi:fumarylacetoacetate hydrolase family protein [Maribacter sp. 2-571]|uniref:fumarylacetoacetate hydrolase family protein n=1 Tax=Maribacter sp. 2-571 TaxID=3417569 RepID=UPI003D32D9A6